eukprot:GCRY01001393.1.p1 GENE.GCRY01001393.1~~GCRY01001393.1.p1  ORF type:complete len:311 (+),score=26.95 GCRY01001393.1:208-1140(+)
MKVAQPLQLVPYGEKACNVEEIVLSHGQLTSLGDEWVEFTDLKALYLNNNKLSTIIGLENNKRLQELCLQDNTISSLFDSSIPHLVHLQKLLLHNNRLSDLISCLGILKHLQQLKYLTLFGNPLVEETEVDYRLYVIQMIPSLEILDRREITAQEYQMAKEYIPFSSENSTAIPTAGDSAGRRKERTQLTRPLKGSEMDLMREARKIRQRRLEAEEESLRKQFADTSPFPAWDPNGSPPPNEHLDMLTRTAQSSLVAAISINTKRNPHAVPEEVDDSFCNTTKRKNHEFSTTGTRFAYSVPQYASADLTL